MLDGLDSVLSRTPKEVKMFLELDKFKKELFVAEYISTSNRKDELDKLVTNIFKDVVLNLAHTPVNIYDYISDVIRHEHDHRYGKYKHISGIVSVDVIFTPEKMTLGYSNGNGFFNDCKDIKIRYENKDINSPTCKQSDYIFVQMERDKVYCCKKIIRK